MGRMWSKIKGFPNYSISENGLVRNDKTGKIKAYNGLRNGYASVDLYNNGKRSTRRIHRLVGDAYLENPDNKSQINHRDGDKLNNDYRNLEYVTPKENMEHAVANGLFTPSYGMLGKKNPNAGRRGKKVRIIETGEVFNSITECALAIDGNDRHICDCISGRQRTHRGYHFEYV